MKTEQFIKLGILYNAFDPTKIEKHELLYRKNTKLKTYLSDLSTDCEWKIGLNGKPVTIEEHGNIRIKHTDTIQLVVVPNGSGGKDILRMVAMVALVVGAAFLFGAGGPLAFSILGSATAGMALGMTLFTLAGGLLINALLPPKALKVDNDDSTSYGYDGAKNTAKEGAAVPVVYGKYRVAGNYVDLYTTQVGDDQYLYGRTVLSDGKITNVSEPYINDQPISNFTDVEWGWTPGGDDDEINPWFNRSIAQITKNIRLVAFGAGVTHTTDNPIDQFNYTVNFPKGLIYVDKKGRKYHRFVTIQAEYRPAGSTGPWTTLPQELIEGKVSKVVRRQFESPILPKGNYEIRIRKISEDGDQGLDDGDHAFDECWLSDVGEIVNTTISHRSIATAYYKIKMTEQINGVPNITWLVDGVEMKHYDINENVTQKTFTDNPAWIVLDMLIGVERGTPGIYEIDYVSFIEWAEWCEEQGLKFNGTFDTTTTLWDACVDVLKIGHATFTRVGTKLSVAVDKPREPVMLFGPGNIFKDTFTINYVALNDRANEYELSYFDREDMNIQKTIRVVDPDAEQRGEIPRPISFSVPGIDTFEQAQKEIWYNLYNNRYIRRSITFDAPVESIGLSIGDVALIQHDVVNWGVSGRLEGGSTTSTVNFDKPVLMEDGNDYSVLLVHNFVTRGVGSFVNKIGNIVTVNSVTGSGITTETCKRITQGSVDREIISIAEASGTYYVTIAGDNDFVAGTVNLIDTDVIEERDVGYQEGEFTSVNVVPPFSAVPSKYSNYMFGVKQIVKKPYTLRGISGVGFDQRQLTFIEYNENVYAEPEHIVPYPTTTLPKTVSHVDDLTFVNDLLSTYDNTIVNGILAWTTGRIKNYGGADIYMSVNGGSFAFYQTVFNTNSAQIIVQSGTDVVFKVVSFNNLLTRANSSTAPTVSLTIETKPYEVGAPINLAAVQISYIATALVGVTWDAPVDLTVNETDRIRYRVQVKPDGETIWDEYGVTNQTNIRIGDLKEGNHIVRVRSELGASVSDWVEDAVNTFTTEETLGGESDITPPGVPTGLAGTSSVSDNGAKINITWNSVADADLAGYILAIREGAGTFIEYYTSTNNYSIDGLKRNQAYTYKVKAYDKRNNTSGFSSTVTTNTASDTVAPSAPTNLTATASFKAIVLNWSNPSDTDLEKVVIYENSVNDSSTATGLTSVYAHYGDGGSFTHNALPSGYTRYYWIKAVDTSGNVSAFSSVATATTVSVQNTDFTPTASGIAPVEIFTASLPTTGNFNGRIGVLLTDGKLYRYSNGWKSNVDVTDVTGQITSTQISDSAITTPKLAANSVSASKMVISDMENLAINGDFASGLENWDKRLTTSSNGSIEHGVINGPGWPAQNAIIFKRFNKDIFGELSATNGRTDFNNDSANLGGFSINPGDEFYFEAVCFCADGARPSVDLVYRNNQGSVNGLASQMITNVVSDGIFTKISAIIANPYEMGKGWLRIGSAGTPTANNSLVYYWNVRLKRRASGSLIVDGAISANKLTADSVVAGKIAAGAVNAREIAAGAITASKLSISGENLFPDSQCQDINWWKGPGQGLLPDSGYVSPSNNQNTIAGWALQPDVGSLSSRTGGSKGHWQLWSGNTNDGFTSTAYADVVCPSIMAKSDTTYELKIGCCNGSNKPLNINIQEINSSGSIVKSSTVITWGAGDQTTKIYAVKYKTRSDCVSVRIYWNIDAGIAFFGFINVGNISFREAASGTLIVDGSIAARHIVAEKLIGDDVIATNTLSGNVIKTTSSLPGTITVGNTGVTIDTVQGRSNNPAARINEQTTTIQPGKILISGGTTLQDWRHGGDNTQINGGAIGANTISANKLTVGNRNIGFIGLNFEWNPTNNYVYWTEGWIYYQDDNNTTVGVNIAAGHDNGAPAHQFFYWIKGEGIIRYTQNIGEAITDDRIQIATWWGGSNLNVNYGGTIINGDRITTGSVQANRITSGSIFTQDLYVGNGKIHIDGPNARIVISD